MKTLFQQYWFIAAPIAMELVYYCVMAFLSKWIYPRIIAHSPHESVELGEEMAGYIDEKGRPKGEFGWVRALELFFIMYHFPIIVPTAYIRKDDTAPMGITAGLTIILYAALLYLLFGRH